MRNAADCPVCEGMISVCQEVEVCPDFPARSNTWRYGETFTSPHNKTDPIAISVVGGIVAAAAFGIASAVILFGRRR